MITYQPYRTNLFEKSVFKGQALLKGPKNDLKKKKKKKKKSETRG